MRNFCKKFTCFIATILSVVLIFPAYAYAGDVSYKFSAIDLKIKVPDHLICFTQTTTGNNAYLKEIGANDANEVQASLKAADIYIEAFDKDFNYEIAVVGMKASESLQDFDSLNNDELNDLFNDYIENENSKNSDELTETITDSSIETINGVSYFYTEVSSVLPDKKNIYIHKYYTVKRGYIYIYSLQSNGISITDAMVDDLNYIINSSEYVSVKKSILENGVFTETLSSILTVALPIAVLIIIYLIITRFGKKDRAKLLQEEAMLREQYKNRKK